MAPIWRFKKMKLSNKMIYILTSLVAFLSILQVASIGLAENFPGGHGGP